VAKNCNQTNQKLWLYNEEKKIKFKTVASHEENTNTGESSPSALFSKFGGSLFGAATGSPQKVVTNIRGFLSNHLPSVPVRDTGELQSHFLFWTSLCITIFFTFLSFLLFVMHKSLLKKRKKKLLIFLFFLFHFNLIFTWFLVFWFSSIFKYNKLKNN